MRVKALKMTSAQTAISSWHKVPLFVYSYFEKGVRKSHATIPKGGWFWVCCSSRKFERMAWEAMDLHVCLPMLKESNKSRFDSFGVRDSALIISHITFRDCPVQVFCDNLSRNSVINGISQALASSLIQYPYPVVQTAEFRVGHDMFLCLRPKFKTQVIYFIYIFIFSFSNLTSVGWFSKFPQKGKMTSEPQHTVIIVTNPKMSRQGLFIIMFDLEFTWAWKCCVIIFNFFLE